MSDANSLPGTLDGTNVHNARTRQENWPTITTHGDFSAAHRVLFDKVDAATSVRTQRPVLAKRH